MNISFSATFWYVLICAGVFLAGCLVGANNPGWFSKKKKELLDFGKKALADAEKAAQAKVQTDLIAPVIAQTVREEVAKYLAAAKKE